MFTGIIESTGQVAEIIKTGTNVSFWIASSLSENLKVDQSLSHNGVCLTVEALLPGRHRVTAIMETLQKTNLWQLETGSVVNLERCMQMNGRLDGHIVQGHVDCTGRCTSKTAQDGSWEFNFSVDEKFAALMIEKGSITLNGISLTIFDVTNTSFSVAIIPYTYQYTNMQHIEPADQVNIEFDMLGKYVNRIASLQAFKP